MENETNPLNSQSQQPGFNMQQDVPNSTAVLVLGILSIVFCWCYGLPGVILGIIALVLAGKGEKLYKANPEFYKQGSYKNLNAGKICAIIGLSLSALMFIGTILAFIINGAMISTRPWEMMNNGY